MVKPLVCFWSSPYFPGRFPFPKEQSGMDPKSVFSHDIFSLLNYLKKCSIFALLVLNPDLGPLVVVFLPVGDQQVKR